jgi:hypothetical protein
VFGHGMVRAMVVFGVLLTPCGASQIATAADGMYRNVWGFTPLSKRSLSHLDRSRPRNLIGVSYEFGNFDPMTAFVNAVGEQWGLSGSWLSNWSADPQTVTTVLASDEQGLAAAWVRGYGGRAGTGFVQLPLVVSPQGFPLNLFAIAIAAEYFP